MANTPGVQVKRLQDQAFAAGGSVSIQTAGIIPNGRRILGVLLRLDVDITQPGGGGSAQLGAVLHQLISQVTIGKRVSMTGLALHMMNWLMGGREPQFPAGFAAGAGNVYSRSVEWWVPYSDSNARSPNDTAVPSELWTEPIEIRFGTTGIFAAAVPALGNGTLRTYVYHGPATGVPGRQGVIPSSVNLQSEDFSNLSPLVAKPGIWTHACIFREASNDAGGITNVQAAAVTSYIDGQPVVENLRASDVAAVYNGQLSWGTAQRVESQTVPVGGEQINSMPGPANGAGQGVTVDFLPLLVPPRDYNLSQLPEAKSAFTALIAGTLATYKLAYRIVQPRSESDVARAAARLGIPAGSAVIKNNGKAAQGRMGRYLPLVVTGGK